MCVTDEETLRISGSKKKKPYRSSEGLFGAKNLVIKVEEF